LGLIEFLLLLMPSAAELDLYVQCDGGSGDAKEDELVARNLGNILDVPRKQVMSFVRTRDRSSVRKLRAVLQDMPNTHWEASSAGSCSAGIQTPSDRSRCVGHSNKQLQARLRELLLGTAYEEFHGSRPGGPSNKPAVAFDGIVRKTYKPEFDRWRAQASDAQVRLLADTCRSLKFFNSDKLASTTYHGTFKSFPGHVAKLVPEKDNARNASKVPLGSIYGVSEKEKQNAAMRQVEHAQRLDTALKRQDDWLRGVVTDKISAPVFSEPVTSSLHKVIRSMPDRYTRSFSRDSWNNDVHNHREVARHEHRFVTPGEKDWNLCGLTGHTISESIYELRNPKLFPDGGSPSRQRLVAAKMARIADDNLHRSKSQGSMIN